MKSLDWRNEYLKETISSKKLDLLKAFNVVSDKAFIEFVSNQYKIESDGNVRARIIQILSNNFNEFSAPIVIDALKDNNIDIRRQAALVLGKVKFKDALVPLLNSLSNPSLEIKEDVINSLKRIVEVDHLDKIIEVYNYGSLHLKRTIPLLLIRINTKEVIDFLKSMLNVPDPIIKNNSIKVLQIKLKAKDAPLFISLIKDRDLRVKKAAIKALGHLKSKRAVKPLFELLKDKNASIRNLATKSLFYIFKADTHFDHVYNFAKSRNLLVREQIIKLLGLLRDKNSIEFLLNALGSRNNKMRNAAYHSLLHLSKEEIPKQLFEGLNSINWQVRNVSAKIIGKIGDTFQKIYLFDLLHDSDNRVRETAIKYLTTLPQDIILHRVEPLIKRANWKVRRSMVKLLILKGTEECFEVLLHYMNDDDLYIRSWIALAFGNYNNIKDFSPFIEMLNDKDPKIRISAAKSLGQLKKRETMDLLLKNLFDDDWNVRREIENALSSIDPSWIKSLN